MADPTTRILAELNTSWEAGVIAKPTFYSGRTQTYRPANSLRCNHADAPEYDAAPGDTLHARVWPFQLYLAATSDANRELMIEQTLKHVRAYGHATLKWKVSRPNTFVDTYGEWTCLIDGHEEAMVSEGAW